MGKSVLGGRMKWDRDDILEALGLDSGAGSWFGPAAIGFGVGALIGATVALLSAPRAGSELRESIVERGRQAIRRGRSEIDELGSQVRPDQH